MTTLLFRQLLYSSKSKSEREYFMEVYSFNFKTTDSLVTLKIGQRSTQFTSKIRLAQVHRRSVTKIFLGKKQTMAQNWGRGTTLRTKQRFLFLAISRKIIRKLRGHVLSQGPLTDSLCSSGNFSTVQCITKSSLKYQYCSIVQYIRIRIISTR